MTIAEWELGLDFDGNSDENHGYMIVTCDDCPEDIELEGSFKECIQELKDKGWKVNFHGKGDYTHTCPDCRTTKKGNKNANK